MESNLQEILLQGNKRKSIDIDRRGLLLKIQHLLKRIHKKSVHLLNERSFYVFCLIYYANGSLSAGGVEGESGACELPNGSLGCEEPNGSCA